VYVSLSKSLHGKENKGTLCKDWQIVDSTLEPEYKGSKFVTEVEEISEQKRLTLQCKKNTHLPAFSINCRLSN